MATVAIVGDGPAGLSAALFLAKNDVHAEVYGQDKTAVHHAELHNYLGIREIAGPAFQQIAREQAADHGAKLHDAEVVEVRPAGDGFILRTADGEEATVDYLVLAAGKPGQRLADQLGLERGDEGVVVDAENRTSVDRVYAAGRLTRQHRSQAIISAGAGARAALDILAREAGRDVVDWDSPPS